MIAKMIVHGPDRDTALNRLTAALGECRIAGTVTNIDFLKALARNEDFAKGDVDTGLIARNLDSLRQVPVVPHDAVAVAALAGLGMLSERKGNDPWERLSGWRHWSEAKQYVLLEHEGTRLERAVTARGHGAYLVEGDGETLELQMQHDIWDIRDTRFRVSIGGHIRKVEAVSHNDATTIFMDGNTFTFTAPDLLVGEAEADAAGDSLSAPMPGLVKKIMTEPGREVSRGDPLVTLEAMKMEHTLAAPRDGRVSALLVSPGEQVSEGDILLSLETEAPGE